MIDPFRTKVEWTIDDIFTKWSQETFEEEVDVNDYTGK